MTTFGMILALLTQLSFLVTCTFFFGVLKSSLESLQPKTRLLIEGVLFGSFTIVIMLSPIQISPGIIFDLRGVVIAVVGATFGIIPASAMSIMVILYRVSVGGVGLIPGAGAIITAFLLGIGGYYLQRRRPLRRPTLLIGLGLLLTLQTYLWLLLLPPHLVGPTLAMIGPPTLLTFPLSSLIFGSLLTYQERHLALEAALSAERTMLRTLIDNVPDYIFIKDRQKRYILSNIAHARAAGAVDATTLIGQPADRFFPNDVVGQHHEDDDAVLRGKRLVAQERQSLNDEGKHIWVSTTKIPLRDERGAIIGVVGISRDITAHKQAEAELQRERNLLRTLIDAVPALVYIKDENSRFIDFNAEIERKFALHSRDELVGKTDLDFFPKDLANKYYADEQILVKTGRPLMNVEEPSVDLRTRHSTWVQTTKAPIYNEHGRVTGLVGVGFDISERKRAELALQAKASEEREFQDMLKTLYEITIMLTKVDRLDDFYRQVVELAIQRLHFDRFGLMLYDAKSVQVVGTYGTDTEGRVAPEHDLHFDPSRLTGILKRTLETQERFAFDPEAELFSNMEPIGVGWNAAAILWSGEESLGWVAADNAIHHQSVTKAQLDILSLYAQTVGTLLGRKQAEAALRASQSKLQTFFEVLPVGVSVLDGSGKIVEMNPALGKILGVTMDGLLNGDYRAWQYHDDSGQALPIAKMPSFIARAQQTIVLNEVIEVIKSNGDSVWTSISAAPLPDTNSGVITVTVDITERKRAEQQAFALAAEQERVRLLREFINDVSHDIRTPLAIIGTSAYFISKTTDPTRLAEYGRRVEQQIAHLGLLMDSFVEIAHLEQQASSLQFSHINLNTLMQTIVEVNRPAARRKGLTLEAEVTETELPVLGDSIALTKAITHVVNNAIQFTPAEGRISMRLYAENDHAIVEVADTGIGIAPTDLTRIFESFYRVDSARSADSGGAGLGLSIARKIIELMKGSIKVQSTVDEGSVFCICLPLHAPGGETPDETEPTT